MRNFLIAIALFFATTVSAQYYKVTFRVTSLPAYHKATDTLFIAGSFNNWNPRDPRTRMAKTKDGSYSLFIDRALGRYELKVTRGSWETAETKAGGTPMENRMVVIESDTVINLTVSDWADHFATQQKKSTANNKVRIIAKDFFIPQLNRYRRIWVYLPSDYATARKKYPVLYMHDGQNLFEDTTAYSGEWGVDEALDSLEKQWGATIVVGIDNGGDKRFNEYSPFDDKRYGKGEGDQYVDFLVKTLRPYINKQFRTKRCGKHNYIAGSSMGGLISLYAILKYPKKFGGAGVFSPAFWVVPQLKDVVEQKAKKVKGKIYFFAGQLESDEMVPDMLRIFEQMRRKSKAQMTTVIRSQGKHNEATWRKEFPLFYQWMQPR